MCLKPGRQYLFLWGDEWLKSKQELAKFGLIFSKRIPAIKSSKYFASNLPNFYHNALVKCKIYAKFAKILR